VRDRRLDFWRGLCLVDMLLVHLIHEGIQFGALSALIVDYTRFAAGGFVFVAGLGVGLVYLARGLTARAAAPAVWRRALYLLGVHYGLTGLIVALDVHRGLRPPAGDPLGLVRDIVLLREAPAYVDVLPLYVAMLLATPLLLTLLRRGLWPIVAVASTALFAWGRHDPTALSPRASVEFPFLLWQAFFVAGLMGSLVVPRLDRRRHAWPIAMVGAWIAFGVMTVLAYGPRFDVVAESTLLSFTKVPLTTGEWLRYFATTLAVVTTSAVAWPRIQQAASVVVITQLGRRSLAVYGAHVFVQMLVLAVAVPLWSIGAAQASFALPAVAALWLCARACDVWERQAHPFAELRYVLRSWGAPPVGIIAAGLLVALTGPMGGDEALVDMPAAVVADLDQSAPDIDLVDAQEEPIFSPADAPSSDEFFSDEPAVEQRDDDDPMQSAVAAPRFV